MSIEETNDNGENGQAEVPLMDGVNAAESVLNQFLQNKFIEAKTTAQSLASRSMYHAVAYGTMLHLQATATLEPSDLEKATNHIKYAVKACLMKRRKAKFADNFTRSTSKAKAAFYAAYSDDEAHAELCYAESLLQWVFLAVLQDEKLVTLIKSSIKLRECYKCYRTCWKIYKNKDWEDRPTRASFECGVLMGVGAFNLLLSLLPSKVLSLLEIAGFSGKKEVGLQLLQEGSKIEHGVRDSLCALIRLVYDLYATQMTVGDEGAALADARGLLPIWMTKCPNSAFFLFLRGRLATLSGDFRGAKDYFFKSISCQTDFQNFYHICYWEMMWCHCVQGEWMDAMKYAERLACESKWSNATYRYLQAVFIIQFLDEERIAAAHSNNTSRKASSPAPVDCDPKDDADGGVLAKNVEDLLESVPQMIQRIAGKSLPIEKFALKKALRFFEQGKRLTLPGLEIMYLWSGFKLINDNRDLVNKFLLIIEAKIHSLVDNQKNITNYTEDFCLATLLKGVCLRCLRKRFQARMCFMEVLMNEKAIRLDRYLLPFSEVELCQIALEEGEIDEAKSHLDKAWNYTRYSLEARLHFRLHSLSAQIKALKNPKLRGSKSLQATPVNSWHNGLNKFSDNDENPFDIQFNSSLGNYDDNQITLELNAEK
ncbi:Tetratricopeptide repeat protein 39B [Echinococcus granulosus]|uniref:Tetratricopeptide repeat protein 39B n=1 Tax=Echinococcus granulosus TaxID=6210 RepID=W6U556_ECHGR|nr:Tetratricopeptide repeat protein 39B [Echinococcus granulosus]EUB56265.1 Tetratricopeptide repeat protein 39B [Echinococcus granulosus]